MNADPNELEKFSALAHRWWDPDAEFRPLHQINPLRLGWITEHTALDNKVVLDVGCGGGILAEGMAKTGAQVTGIDLSEKVIKIAQLHSLESGVSVRYEKQSAEELAKKDQRKYDVVTCMEMLEHVPEPALTVRACAELAKPGGWVFFSTLNRNPKSFLCAIVGAEYLLRMLPKGTHDYSKFIMPAELSQFVRDAGLEVHALKGLRYNPLTNHYALCDDVSVNYLMACTKPR